MDFLRRAEMNKAVDPGRLRGQVVVQPSVEPVSDRQDVKFAAQQLQELRAGLIDFRLAGGVFATGSLAPIRPRTTHQRFRALVP